MGWTCTFAIQVVSSLCQGRSCITSMKSRLSPSEFPMGEKAENVHHVGVVWRSQLVSADTVFSYGVSEVAYEPGARLDWHKHPGGQILLITEGTGFYQERGKPKQTIRKGDIIKCQPGVEHWHGSTPQSGITYIATTPSQNGPTVWLNRVTDQEHSLRLT